MKSSPIFRRFLPNKRQEEEVIRKIFRRGVPPWLILVFVFLGGVAIDGVFYAWLDAFCHCGPIAHLILAFLLTGICAIMYLVIKHREDNSAALCLHMSPEEYRAYIRKQKKLLKEQRRNHHDTQ